MTAVAERAPGAAGKPRRRLILWVCAGVAAVLAILIGIFASAPQASVQLQSPLLGQSAPSLAGPVIDGSGQASLASQQGKWVLVNFFASWCGPCQDEMPQLLAFQHQHAGAGDATILGVEYDQTDVGNARSYLASQKATWPVISDDSADVRWGVHGIPESYLVAPDGLVAVKYAGDITESSLDAQIAKLGGAATGASTG
jgi:cytochrome c biogenesis protein CcmG, thiol:disulfide interchange protein DsbE